MEPVITESDIERDRLVTEALKVVRLADEGATDLDPRVVVLCRRIEEAHDRGRKAVRDALTVLGDPYGVAGPRETAEGRAQTHMDALYLANRDIDLTTLEIHKIAQEEVV